MQGYRVVAIVQVSTKEGKNVAIYLDGSGMRDPSRKERKSRNECGEQIKNICAQRKYFKKERQKACVGFSSRVPTPPARVPSKRRKETQRSVMPILEEVVSATRDATGLLPPWQPQLAE
jgi:hypothetical protein